MISFIRPQDNVDDQSRKTLLFPPLNQNVFREIMIKAQKEKMERKNKKIFAPPLKKNLQADENKKETATSKPSESTVSVNLKK